MRGGRTGAERLGAERWQALLAGAAERAGVPGATLAIAHGGERIELAHGLLDVEGGAAATPDALFQIASVTKAWTAAAALQLVESGPLGLDAPVRRVLPELRLGDERAARAITLRHLLAHTSGLDGDLFTDTGDDDDCLARYVEQLADVGQTHAVGAAWSYCNAGYMIAGRVIERLTGETWDEALRRRLIEPLGLERTVAASAAAGRGPVAAGHHLDGPRARPVRAQVPRSNAPAGGLLSSAGDQLTFALALLRGGAPILSAASAAAMREQAVAIGADGLGWTLGLMRRTWAGGTLVGHDGSGFGQAAYLRMLPDRDLAFALLTNAGPLAAQPLFAELWRAACEQLAGVAPPPEPTPPARPVEVDPARYVGVYERTRLRTEVVERDGGLLLRRIVVTPLAGLDQHEQQEWPLVATGEGRFLAQPPGTSLWVTVAFDRFADGRPYVHYLMRANPKIA